MLDPAGPVADANRTILVNATVIMLAIIVPTIIATLAFAWWYREGNTRADYKPDFVYSGRVELLVWSIPLLTIMFLGGVIWIGSHQLDPHKPLPAKSAPLEVQVVALDWKWLFIYPAQGVATVNVLPLPAGVPVHFKLTSASVMNSFFIPRLGSQIYAMSGMQSELWLQADKPGRYPGVSAHFSGDGFSHMGFQAVAMPPQQFAAWTAQARAGGRVLDARTYPLLARQSQNVAPFTIGQVQPNLFAAIVDQTLPPSQGPIAGRGGPHVKENGGE
ncbi:ubiquinol oxidase subunit II [Sphingomonas ginsengisoli (ex An et al. 2013)]|uniref:ubiquinol oxidase subunit II n=1 Tax=Sphingomonas ginsengisoli (ex An et al. 2013) TaxID=363835 RepID=UPI001FE54686|nr:ubiquinol oxidase subunit II [Sphingomonas ginsengisoli An et al. 2013]